MIPDCAPPQPPRSPSAAEKPPVAEVAPQVGDLCPVCHAGRLDYDGLLNLACPVCGKVFNTGGGFT